MRTSGAALALVLFVVSTSCAVETAPPDRVGDVGDTSGEALKVACNLSRDAILASAQGGRQTAIQRGFSWYDAQVPYSQSKQYGGYRTDCSGFISMCWELGTSYTTANFIDDTAEWSSLGSFGELNPADAMVYRKGSSGHIMMFLGWNDAAHTEACVLEQASTAEDMQFRARTIDSLVAGGYHAIQNTAYSSAPGGPGQGPGQGQQCYCDADCAQYGDCCSNCPTGTGGGGGGGTGGSSGSGGAGTGGGAGSGGSSGGGQCYCDADCAQYGDCCSNCGGGAGGSGGSSGGSGAGGSSGGQCYCDADCSYYGDCCSNCGGGAGGGAGGSGGGACYCDITCLFYGDCCTTCP